MKWCRLLDFLLEMNMLTLPVIGTGGILWRTADGNWRGNKQVAKSLAAFSASIFQCLALIRLYLHTTPAKIVLLLFSDLLVCASNHLLWRYFRFWLIQQLWNLRSPKMFVRYFFVEGDLFNKTCFCCLHLCQNLI